MLFGYAWDWVTCAPVRSLKRFNYLQAGTWVGYFTFVPVDSPWKGSRIKKLSLLGKPRILSFSVHCLQLRGTSENSVLWIQDPERTASVGQMPSRSLSPVLKRIPNAQGSAHQRALWFQHKFFLRDELWICRRLSHAWEYRSVWSVYINSVGCTKACVKQSNKPKHKKNESKATCKNIK